MKLVACAFVLALVHGVAGLPGTSYGPFVYESARFYKGQEGVTTKIDCNEGCLDTSIYVNVDNADSYIVYSLDFGTKSATSLAVYAAGVYNVGQGVEVNFSLDDPTAEPIGSVTLTNTGGSTNWVAISNDLTVIPKGVHDVYVTFTTDTTLTVNLVNIQGFQFFE